MTHDRRTFLATLGAFAVAAAVAPLSWAAFRKSNAAAVVDLDAELGEQWHIAGEPVGTCDLGAAAPSSWAVVEVKDAVTIDGVSIDGRTVWPGQRVWVNATRPDGRSFIADAMEKCRAGKVTVSDDWHVLWGEDGRMEMVRRT